MDLAQPQPDQPGAVPVPTKASAVVLDETIVDVNSATSHYLFHSHFSYTLGLLMGCVIWILAVFYFASPTTNPNAYYWMFVPVVFAVAIFWGIVFNQIEHLFYMQFAQANGFQYQKSGSLALSGALFSLGHSHITKDIVTGSYQNNPLTLFNYSYTEGSGKSQHTYSDTVFKIQYPSVLPPILLVVGNQYFGGITGGVFSSWEKIKPEGNFDKKFNLYTKKEFEIETLQVFTPDFMQKMLAEWPEFSLEFSGSDLIVFHNYIITTKAELQKMYDFAEYLITKIDPLAKQMENSVKDLEALQHPSAV